MTFPTPGMDAAGFGCRAGQPSLARLAHIRAVLAARPWLQASPALAPGQPGPGTRPALVALRAGPATVVRPRRRGLHRLT